MYMIPLITSNALAVVFHDLMSRFLQTPEHLFGCGLCCVPVSSLYQRVGTDTEGTLERVNLPFTPVLSGST